MAEFKNTSGEDIELPTLGVAVKAGGTVEGLVRDFADHPYFTRTDKPDGDVTPAPKEK